MSETLTTTTTDVVASAEEQAAEQVGALAEQIVGMLGSATELLTIELGRRFGLYRTLHEAGPMTATAFADATRVAPRYAREWLEQQAAAGYLAVVEPGVFGHERRFVLPELHAPVFIDETHPAHVAPAASLFAGVALAFPELVADYRRGRGVAYDEYGAELRGGLGSLNRPGFTHELRGWVDTLPDRAAALDAGGAVLDAGCGVGWSTIALANAFPNARIVGLDLDEASIVEARRNAREAGVADRISFVHGNAGDKATIRAAAAVASTGMAEATGGIGVEASGFDLVTVFEALHDMGEPVDALAWCRALLRTGGARARRRRARRGRVPRRGRAGRAHALRDERAALPARDDGRVERRSRTARCCAHRRVRRWAAEAGFGRVDVLDIENPFWRFYRIG